MSASVTSTLAVQQTGGQTNQRAYPKLFTGSKDEIQKAINQMCDWIFQLASSSASYYGVATDALLVTTNFKDVPGCAVQVTQPGHYDVSVYASVLLDIHGDSVQLQLVLESQTVYNVNQSFPFTGLPLMNNLNTGKLLFPASFAWIVIVTPEQIKLGGQITLKLQANKLAGGTGTSNIFQPTVLKAVRIGP